MEVFVQGWAESERGFGQRPDGLSIHFSMEQRNRYVHEYNTNLPATPPECYSFADGEPYWATIVREEANEDILTLVLKGETFLTHKNNPKWLRKI